MINILLNGCNGKMGRVIAGIVNQDENARIICKKGEYGMILIQRLISSVGAVCCHVVQFFGCFVNGVEIHEPVKKCGGVYGGRFFCGRDF